MKHDVDASTAAQLLAIHTENPIGAIRGFIESAVAIAAPAQRALGRIADGEFPSDPEVLRKTLAELEQVRSMLDVAAQALGFLLEGVRPTAPGGSA